MAEGTARSSHMQSSVMARQSRSRSAAQWRTRNEDTTRGSHRVTVVAAAPRARVGMQSQPERFRDCPSPPPLDALPRAVQFWQ